ncbi:MAG: PHP domain-containing protein [Ruminococcaceae bacterium]|nr:PHP domain-containing protein [Oscillospiraceae bacterium]
MYEYIKKSVAQYKANLHCHSTRSDGKLSPSELKKIYKEQGYSVLAITDHEAPYDYSEMSENDFLMITGYEAYIRPTSGYDVYRIYKPEIHINLLAKEPHNLKYINFNDEYCKYIGKEEKDLLQKVGSQEKRRYDTEYINSFIRTAKENGYICTYNHPTWSMEDYERIMEYEGFFSMEMCNYGSYLLNRAEYNANLYDRMLRSGRRIFVHSADDNHNAAPLDSPASDSFGAFTMILSRELSYQSVIEALERGDFYSSMGPLIKELVFDGNKVHIETSPVRQITMHDGGKRTAKVIGDEENPVTSADFIIPDAAKYVRLSAFDFRGGSADTRGFFRDEFENF